MKSRIILAALSLSVGGCTSGLLRGKQIDAGVLRSTKAVPFAEIVQNIRCDVQAYLSIATEKTFSIGGVVSATTLNEMGQKAGGGGAIPIAPSLEIALAAQKTSTSSFGSLEREAFVIYNDPADKLDKSGQINCTRDEAFPGGPPKKIKGALLNLAARREDLNKLEKGRPHILLKGFERSGSILLVDGGNTSAGVKVYFINLEASSSKTASYRIDYALSTNWQPLVAPFEAAKPKVAEAPAPTVLYLVNGAPPAARQTVKPKPGVTPPVIPQTPDERLRKTLENAVLKSLSFTAEPPEPGIVPPPPAK